MRCFPQKIKKALRVKSKYSAAISRRQEVSIEGSLAGDVA
jgi:hypothetical protein